MKYLLIYTKKDIASMNIKDNLDKLNCPYDYFEYPNKLTEVSQKDLPDDYDYYIFLSKHRSANGTPPTFTVHTSGNLTEDNSHGGNPEEISPCDGVLNSLMLKSIYELNNREYKKYNFQVSFEGVHHGPTDLNVPSLFVEIGSSEKEWKIPDAGELIANSILNTLKIFDGNLYQKKDVVIGFGGGHYAPKFTEYVLNDICYVGYIIPKYASLSEKVLNEIINKQKFDYILMDWKGIKGEDKRRYIEFFENNGILWKKTKDINKD